MKNKVIYLALSFSLIMILTGASCTVDQSLNQPTENNQINNSPVNESINQPINQLPTEIPPAQTPNETSYNLEAVAKHNLETDCWIVINDKVYNATNYITLHPGGPGFKKYCGQDATQSFNAKPAHQTEKAIKDLNNLIVGNLSK